MKWLKSKWFDKVFLTVCWLLLFCLILGFVFVGGYIKYNAFNYNFYLRFYFAIVNGTR